MLTDFQNPFNDRLSGKLAIRSLWNISPHLRYVTSLPCEIFMFRNCLFLLKNMLSGRVRQSVFWNVRHLRLSRQICGLQSPNSPELNPVDYKIWGVMQQRVYQTKVQDLNDLKRRLINVWAEMQQSVIDDTIDQWRKRLYACVRARGGHFEHALWLENHFN